MLQGKKKDMSINSETFMDGTLRNLERLWRKRVQSTVFYIIIIIISFNQVRR
jgi:hypothetical protein